MTELIEIANYLRESTRDSWNRTELSFPEWKIGQLRLILRVAEAAKTHQEIKILREAMMMPGSQDLAEGFPKMYAFESEMYRYLCDKHEYLINQPKLNAQDQYNE